MATYYEEYKCETRWFRRAKLVAIYHAIRVRKIKTWRVRDTAEYFGIGIGTASENLKIAKNWKKVKGLNSRNLAVKRLRGFKV